MLLDKDLHTDLMATLKFFAVLSVSAVLLQLVACDQVEIDLTGDAWTLTEEGGRVKDIPAVVPGQVHLDLLYVIASYLLCTYSA